jgi:putative endonuclease
MFYFIYILQSKLDKNFYTGFTSNLKNRFKEHNSGRVESTKSRRPFNLVYFEGCLSKKDAMMRELYLKTAWGKRYIKNRIKNHLNNF